MIDFIFKVVTGKSNKSSLLLSLDHEGNQISQIEIEGHIKALDYAQKTDEIVAVTKENSILNLTSEGVVLSKYEVDFNIQKLATSKDAKSFVALDDLSNVLFMEILDDDTEVFYEILCRGKAKCGTFVSAVYTVQCPKCASERNTVRIIKEKL